MSKRVLILTAMDPYRDIRANKVAKTLTKIGNRIKVVGGYSSEPMINNVYPVGSYSKRYPARGSLYSKILWKINYFFYIKSIYKDFQPEILHCANIDMLLCGYLLGSRKCKLIYDSYEINAQKSGVASKSKLISKLIELIERFLLKKVFYMIAVSHSAKNYFIHKYEVKNIEVVTNVPIKIDIKVKNNSTSFNVLYVGSYTTERGIEEFILSGKYLQEYNIKLLLQGFGPYEEELRNLVKENDLSNVVQFLQPVNPEEILSGIRENARVGVVLTRPTSLNHRLTVSNKLFDYINAHVPIIMSGVDEHRMINEKYNIGIIVNEINPQNIANSILKLYRHDDYYDEIQNNVIDAAKKFHWGIEELNLISIYDKIGDLNEI